MIVLLAGRLRFGVTSRFTGGPYILRGRVLDDQFSSRFANASSGIPRSLKRLAGRRAVLTCGPGDAV
jgi:hypothetical protein